MTNVHDLYGVGGQSPWVDDLKRSYLAPGGIDALIELGVRGLTSNPTILAKSIEAGHDYDEQFADVVSGGTSVDDAYWDLVLHDAAGALALFRPLYDRSSGGDGYVSVEVSPTLAHDTPGTTAAARALSERVAAPNLLVKIPATREGLPAIEEMIAEGRSVNVTLIFSLERYAAVIDAYERGLDRLVAGGGDASSVASVASFFVSRVDTEVDRRLDAIVASDPGSPRAARAAELRGQAAVAQARLAYALFRERFTTGRLAGLVAGGATLQRPLWASTSTKNPAYPDLVYVDSLIGPDTVNTMPPATIDAFADHGVVARTIDADLDGAHAAIAGLAEVGVELADVTEQLEVEGVASFAKSFEELLDGMRQKAATLGVGQ
ncbi:MAG TPA: transaldolase [Acidimicrobiales bacterium]|nr:transaldolase [Acidimicrobiales bacterium]